MPSLRVNAIRRSWQNCVIFASRRMRKRFGHRWWEIGGRNISLHSNNPGSCIKPISSKLSIVTKKSNDSRRHSRVDPSEKPLPPDRKHNQVGRKSNNDIDPKSCFDRRTETYRLFGVDVTQIPGIGNMALSLFTELGRDLSKWPTSSQFASWLALCTDNDISGGRVLWQATRKLKNRAGQLFRMAANSLHPSPTYLGNYLRRMKAKLGAPAGITATAHKIAIVFYTLVTKQIEYDESVWAEREAERQKRFEAKIKRQAKKLGFQLVPIQQNV